MHHLEIDIEDESYARLMEFIAGLPQETLAVVEMETDPEYAAYLKSDRFRQHREEVAQAVREVDEDTGELMEWGEGDDELDEMINDIERENRKAQKVS